MCQEVTSVPSEARLGSPIPEDDYLPQCISCARLLDFCPRLIR